MKDLTQGREIKTILLFSLPILVGNLFQQLYNISDTIIVGNFLGKECLAAVGFSFQIHFLLISLSTGISIGTSILISRYFGEKDMGSVKKVMDTGFVFCLLRGFIIGDSKAPTCILIAAALLNIILDILFIKAFSMGVAGAAIATVFADCILERCAPVLFSGKNFREEGARATKAAAKEIVRKDNKV